MICPLDWGLGHATRCIPIIRYLQQKGVKVVIAADKRPLELLKKEFPEMEFIQFPGYEIAYPGKGSMAFKMIRSIPAILRGISTEHWLLEKIIHEHHIDAVISDNRFGCWSENIPSVFITHQVMIKTPVGEKLLHQLDKGYISKYACCWIPDVKGKPNLSGDLSHKYPLPSNACFIGPLSRFERNDSMDSEPLYDLMVILSGPEPQRSLLETKLLHQLKKYQGKVLVVRGVTEETKAPEQNKNIAIVNHLKGEEMQQAILSSSLIIGRSGYSTIMDMTALGKKIIFIPTPGQTEQEYLATYFQKQKIAPFMKQKDFNLKKMLEQVKNYKGFSGYSLDADFKVEVDKFVDSILN